MLKVGQIYKKKIIPSKKKIKKLNIKIILIVFTCNSEKFLCIFVQLIFNNT